MTLTSLLPTLRHSIPSPFARELWPAGALPAVDDVTVTGISVLRYVELCGTPCVMTGAAVIPHSGGIASTSDTVAVLTVSVVEVLESDAAAGWRVDPTPVVVLDAVLDAAAPCWNEARLIGRVSDVRDRRFALTDAAGVPVPGVGMILPGDLRSGDLVTVPCAGVVSVGDVRPRCGTTGEGVA